MATHDLKTVEPHFSNVLNGSKTFEIRLNDRDYQVGDYLMLMEYPFTGELHLTVEVKVTHILTHDDYPQGIKPGYVVMSITNPILQDCPR